MAFPPLPKRRTGPADDAFARGDRPGGEMLGRFKKGIFDPRQLDNPFLSQRDNPDPGGFADNSQFTSDVAAQSEQKMRDLSQTDFSSFGDDRDAAASDFLAKYAQSVERGLIGEEERISSATLGRIASQPAAAGSNERSPNTAGKFPNQGVNV